MRNVVTNDIEYLHQKSEPVDFSSKNNRSIECKNILMSAYNSLNGKCMGLSAIQCKYPYCAILLRYEKGSTPVVVYNPKVLLKIGSKKSNEGCLSENDVRYIIKRPVLAKVSYQLEDGTKVVEWLPFSKARIFCHETDHCNGILLQDHGKVWEGNQ